MFRYLRTKLNLFHSECSVSLKILTCVSILNSNHEDTNILFLYQPYGHVQTTLSQFSQQCWAVLWEKKSKMILPAIGHFRYRPLWGCCFLMKEKDNSNIFMLNFAFWKGHIFAHYPSPWTPFFAMCINAFWFGLW